MCNHMHLFYLTFHPTELAMDACISCECIEETTLLMGWLVYQNSVLSTKHRIRQKVAQYHKKFVMCFLPCVVLFFLVLLPDQTHPKTLKLITFKKSKTTEDLKPPWLTGIGLVYEKV